MYKNLIMQLESLSEGITYPVTILSNAAAILFNSLEDINWAGFYILDDSGDEGGTLLLGPFQGKPACMKIPVGKGVCGTAVARNETVLVRDVHEFPGHIACDSASNSEIVVPIHSDDAIYGVLDIDSPCFGRFTDDDRRGLEEFVAVLEKYI
ncbi:MAG: GAF domain-containing protein [Spirochaetaceae bacterium]|nr:GAF domain-containing protein [Spirochaetaceae bacterium]